MAEYWDSLWDVLWWTFGLLVFLAYLMALFSVIGDLFRDRETSGGKKALWLVFLLFLPLLTTLVYLVVRGGGMAERAAQRQGEARAAVDDHIRSVAGGPAQEIAHAKKLLDDGTITPAEFEQLKQNALRTSPA